MRFDERDVVRHKLVQQIVKAYEAFSNGSAQRDRPARSRRRDATVVLASEGAPASGRGSGRDRHES